MTGVIVSMAADWVPSGYAPHLFVGLLLAGLSTVALFGLGLAAYLQRRSTEYLLVTLALGGLVVRTLVGWGTAMGVVPMVVHHVAAHLLDFTIAALVLYTVYRRGPSQSTDASQDA